MSSYALADRPQESGQGGPATDGAGIRILDHSPGRATVEMTVTPNMLNGFDHCHGGYVFMLADTAFGMSCNGFGPRAVGADTSIVFMRPAELGMVLTAVGERGTGFGRNVMARSVVTDQDGREIAELTGRCVLVRENHSPDRTEQVG